MLVAGQVTTGQTPLVAGSTYNWTLNAKRNGQWWDQTPNTVTLKVKDPTGTITSYVCTIAAGIATSGPVSPTAIAGLWTWCWVVVANGIAYISIPQGFNVVSSP